MILFKAGHREYIKRIDEFRKMRSFLEGGRWNEVRTPVLYFSSNVQNAMLELSNYVSDPVLANALNVIGVFETPSLRLHYFTPQELPAGWHEYPFQRAAQTLGSSYLDDPDYDGFVVPSCAINLDLAASPHNEVRDCIYANVVVNPEREAVKKFRYIDAYTPVYSSRAFVPASPGR